MVMATGKITSKLATTSFTPTSASIGISLNAVSAVVVGGKIAVVSFEAKDDGAVAAYRDVAQNFPLPTTDTNVTGVDSNGTVYPAYINSTNGKLITRKAYTQGLWIRYGFAYIVS